MGFLGSLLEGVSLLGGSWAVTSYKWGVTSPVFWAISIAALLMPLLVTTHEPPSSSPVVHLVPLFVLVLCTISKLKGRKNEIFR